MKKKLSFAGVKRIFKASVNGFSDDKLTKLSGSLAYSTFFSLCPLLIVIISLCSIFLSKSLVEQKVFLQLSSFIGRDTVIQIQQIMANSGINGKNKIALVIGCIALVLGATAVFGEIQDSINMIWGIKPKPKKGWLKMLQNRFLSFSIIVSLVFLLLVSLVIGSVIDGFSNRLETYFHHGTVNLFYVVNLVLTFIIITIIFLVIFKVLPDADIQWKDVFAGSLVASFLFMIGKFVISYYISKANITSTYGAAGSLVVILLWVYYSSIILFFGAEISKAYALEVGAEIHPNRYAVTTKTVEVETGSQTIQAREKINIGDEKHRS